MSDNNEAARRYLKDCTFGNGSVMKFDTRETLEDELRGSFKATEELIEFLGPYGLRGEPRRKDPKKR
jgi:hypothetical protein